MPAMAGKEAINKDPTGTAKTSMAAEGLPIFLPAITVAGKTLHPPWRLLAPFADSFVRPDMISTRSTVTTTSLPPLT